MSSRRYSSPRKQTAPSGNLEVEDQQIETKVPENEVQSSQQDYGNQAASEQLTDVVNTVMDLLSSGNAPEMGGDEEGDPGFDDLLNIGGMSFGGGGGDDSEDGGGEPQRSTDEMLQASSAKSLPEEVSTQLQDLFGFDFSHVQVHVDSNADEATKKEEAKAFTMGSHWFFQSGQFNPTSPAGLQLIMAEAAHTMQDAFGLTKNRESEGFETSETSDPLESQSRMLAYEGDLLARKQSNKKKKSAEEDKEEKKAKEEGKAKADTSKMVKPELNPVPTSDLDAGKIRSWSRSSLQLNKVAYREAAPTTGSSSGAAEEKKAPKSVTMNIGGSSLTANLPDGVKPETTITVTVNSPIKGLNFNRASIKLDKEFKVESGSVNATVSLGKYVTKASTSLEVSKGGQIQGTIEGAKLNIPNLLTGTMNLAASEGGLSGSGEISGPNVTLAHGIKTDGGTITASVTPEGVVAGSGTITGAVQGVAKVDIRATLKEAAITGGATATLTGSQSKGKVTFKSGSLTGNYSKEAMQVAGDVTTNYDSFAEATLKGRYDVAQDKWNAFGDVKIVSPKTIGDTTLTAGSVQIDVKDSELKSADADADFTTPQGQGKIKGKMDVSTGAITGSGSFTLTPGLAMAAGAKVKSGTGEAKVDASKLTKFSGEMAVTIPMGGSPAFEVSAESVEVTFPEPKLSGSFTFKTLRAIDFGTEAAHVRLAAGSSATGTITENKLTSIDSAIAFSLADSTGDFAKGTLTGTIASDQISAELKASLTTNYGFPERASTENYLKSGGQLTLSVAANTLQTATIKDLGFHVTNPNKQGGAIEGTVNGTADFTTGEITGTVESSVSEEWILTVPKGSFKLQTGGTVKGTFENSEIKTADVNVPYLADFTAEKQLIKLKGDLKAKVDMKASTAEGNLTGTLQEDVIVQPEANGGFGIFALKGSELSGAVKGNLVESVTGTVQLRVDKGGEFAKGQVTDATWNITTGKVSGTGEVSLTQEIVLESQFKGNKRLEGHEAVLSPGSKIAVNVTDNVFKDSQIDAKGKLRGQKDVASATLKGTYALSSKDGFTGDVTADLHTPIEWGKSDRFSYDVDKGSHIEAKLTKNSLTTAKGTANVAVKEGEKVALAKITMEPYTPGGNLSGKGEFSVIKKFAANTGADKLWLHPGTMATGTIAANALTLVDGTAQVTVDLESKEAVKGDFKGKWDAKTKALNGEGKGTLTRNLPFTPKGQKIGVTGQTGLTATMKFTGEMIDELGVDGDVMVDDGKDLAKGNMKGDWKRKGNEVTGKGDLSLVRELVLKTTTPSAPKFDDIELALLNGSQVKIDVAANTFNKADINAKGAARKASSRIASSTLKGSYALGDQTEGFEGDANALLEKPLEITEGQRWGAHLKKGADPQGKFQTNTLTQADGQVGFMVTDKKADAIDVDMKMDTYKPGGNVSGKGKGTVVKEILAIDGKDKIYIMPSTTADIEVKNDTVESVKGSFAFRYHLGGKEATFKGDVTNGSWTALEQKFTGDLSLEVLANVELGKSGEHTHTVQKGATGKATIKSDVIEKANFAGTVLTNNGKEDWLKLTVTESSWTREPASLDMKASGVLLAEIDTKLGFADYTFFAKKGGQFTVDVVKNTVQTINGKIPWLVKKGGTDLFDGSVQGTWSQDPAKVDGSADFKLLQDLAIAENVGKRNFSYYVSKGSTAHTTITASKFTEISGVLDMAIHESGSAFATAKGQISYKLGDENEANVDGTLTVTRKLDLAEAGKYKMGLETGSGAHVVVTKNELTTIDGTVDVSVKRDEKDFAKVQLKGSWREEDGFNGTGTADLLIDRIEAAKLGPYTLFLVKGSGVTLNVTKSEVKKISGTLPTEVDDKDGKFLKASIKGDVELDKEVVFTGTGTAEVVSKREMATTSKGDTWSIMAGTGATVSIEENDLKKLGGAVNLEVTHEKAGNWLDVGLQGSLDVAKGIFSGTGTAKVKAERMLVENMGQGNYSFGLTKNAKQAATIKIAENKITEVGGTVPFIVKQDGSALLEGAAGGTWTAASGEFTGSGSVFLARDITYDVGNSTKLKFHKGSGGEGKVEKNLLRELGGKLEVTVNYKGEDLVRVTGDGQYDAVDNILKKATGKAELLKDFELFNGKVVAKGGGGKTNGSATIENNALKEAKAHLDLEIMAGGGKFSKVKASTDIELEADGAGFKTWGSLTLEAANLIDSDVEGRQLSGSITGKYTKEGKLSAKGSLSYDLNSNLGSTFDAAVDETWDPVFGGSLKGTGNLMEGFNVMDVKKPIFNMVITTPIGPFTVGAEAFLKMDVDALTMTTEGTFSGWKPMSDFYSVPNFTISSSLAWGGQVEAGLRPYLVYGIKIPGVTLAAGAEGEVGATAAVSTKPEAELKGESGKYSASLGIGVGVSLSAKVAIKLFAEAAFSEWSARGEFGLWEKEFPDVFAFDWATGYTFGDDPPGKDGPKPTASKLPGTEKKTEVKASSTALNTSQSTTGSSSVQGGPQVDGKDAFGDKEPLGEKQDAKKEGPLETLEKITGALEGFQYLADIGSDLFALLTTPTGVIRFIWNAFRGKYSWEKLTTAIDKVKVGIQLILEYLKPLVSEWWDKLSGIIGKGKPPLLGALIGDQSQLQSIINDGTTLQLADADVMKDLLKVMDGWSSNSDQKAAVKVVQALADRGMINKVIDSKTANHLLRKAWGKEDSQIRKLFIDNGVNW